ncbi:unnamed protein product [Echinostoma caproni]|uniref:Ras-associating domain-containing protein n=1 Tax=Echinostoma caproni TaxID=27848 RepID=A0A183BB98_9TREM|nr:unnamed protein product [Echinostoma caproni]
MYPRLARTRTHSHTHTHTHCWTPHWHQQHATIAELHNYRNQQTQMTEYVDSHRAAVESVCELGRQLVRVRVPGMERIELKVYAVNQRFVNLCAADRDRRRLIHEWITLRDMLQEMELVRCFNTLSYAIPS